MMGRAGRKHDGTGAKVDVVVDSGDTEFVEKLTEGGSAKVKSVMSDSELLASALISEVYRGTVPDLEAAGRWCGRSLLAYMGGRPPVALALQILEEVEAIQVKGGKFFLTPVGECAARFYFHPADVFAWQRNFSLMFELGVEDDDVAPAWAVGNVPFDRVVGDLGPKRELISTCAARLPLGLGIMEGSAINVTIWWSVMGGPGVGQMRPAVLERRRDFGRVLSAIRWMFKDSRDRSYLEELRERVALGVPTRLIDICRKGRIGKAKAAALYSMGVRSTDDASVIIRKAGDLDDEDSQPFEEGP
jgi:hypothetical protein